MSVTAYVVIAVAVVLASCLQASIGFGMGTFAAPVVAIVDPSLIPGMLIMLATLVTLMVTIRERAHVDLRGTGWALAGRVPGTVAGALLVLFLPDRGLALLLAGVVLLGVVVTSFGWSPQPHRPNLVVAGAASGLLGTATSIGGPPMALVWQGSSGARLRGTMSGFFLIGSVFSLVMLTVTGSVDMTIVWTFVALLPAPFLGYAMSRYVNRLLDPQRLRWTAISVSAGGAVVLVGQQLLAL